MKNLEIKAHYTNIKKAEKILDSENFELISSGFQKDTYFKTQKGFLKLRETDGNNDFLIWYKRRKKAGPKLSEYYTYKVERPEDLKNLLNSPGGSTRVTPAGHHRLMATCWAIVGLV